MLSIQRIVAGPIFFSAGAMKLVGYPPSPVPLPRFEVASQLGVAAILETVGGLAIILGAFTRPVAFVLAGEMAAACFRFHLSQSFFPTVNNGIPAVRYCFARRGALSRGRKTSFEAPCLH